jgi:glutamate N-acetyltransferase/amino-acid N-acetyltransferase
MPMAAIESHLPHLVASLTPEAFGEVAQTIMTTDTFPKAVLKRQVIQGKEITLAGIAKGAGMISPKMATMLSFVLTDAVISLSALRQSLKKGVQQSFNRVTVDGDMSTSDTLFILANGQAGNRIISPSTLGFRQFSKLLQELLFSLAKMVAQDGEGATKLVRIVVEKARTLGDAERVARAVANSPLVKTAFFGEDANWGRILCAAGYSGDPINPEKVDIFFDEVKIVHRGQTAGLAKEEEATQIMKKREYTVRVNLHQGTKSTFLFTTDFSYDYVKINASYRT